MLLGHIDMIDRDMVRGWAADTDRPYGTLEVAVFVDGQLAGLARADQARNDLKDPATLGSGVHGIAYKFDPALSAQQDHDVVVRFVEGGRLLGQWRVTHDAEVTPPKTDAPGDAAADVPGDAAADTTPAVSAGSAAPIGAPDGAPEDGPDGAPKGGPDGGPKGRRRAARDESGALPGQTLVGFVDVFTRDAVAGWAASKTNPDEVVDISVFVDERKVAQVTCNRPRADLAKAGNFGDGARAFFHRFDPPLPDDRETRVTVVHAGSGEPLSGWDVRLVDGKVQRVEAPPPLAEDEPRLLPAPSDLRAMFDLLGLYDERGGLAQLLSRLAFADQRPEAIHYGVFGTRPASVDDVLRWGRYYPRDHLRALLLSDEFQTGLIPLFLRAFPEKRRLIFVHIPKCAGTDLTFHFRARHSSLDRTLTEPNWTAKPAMLQRIARVVAHVRIADSIFVHGHTKLTAHIAADVIRPTDRVFTVIRDPLAAAISQINYILTRFNDDFAAGQLRPDTREWAETLELGAAPERISDEFVKRVTRAALRSERLTVPNALCLWLGGGGAAQVLERLTAYDVEVTDMERYNPWLSAAWGIDAATRWNESKKFISIQDLATEDVTYLDGITREDQRLYRTVERMLTAAGKVSLRGDDLRGATVA
jgi:hypothetical protein